MGIKPNGRRPRTTSSLVSIGGLVIALITGAGFWVGHEEAGTADTSTSTSTSTSTDTGTGTGTQSDTSSSNGVSQGNTATSPDATTTGS